MSQVVKENQTDKQKISPNLIINDVTLRDGSHAIKHQLNFDDFRAYAEAIDSVGLDIVEVGTHGNGLGASSIHMGQALCSELTVLKTVRQVLKKTKLGVHIISGFATIKRDIIPAIDAGVDIFRVASMCTEADTSKKQIEFLRKEQRTVYGVLMMSHMVDHHTLLKQAKKMEEFGAEGLILMDSAGAYLMDDVRTKITHLRENLSIPLGFHAHNNFNLGVANSLTALECGATIVDATSGGFGAGSGNTILEVLVTVLQKMGYRQEIDLFALYDAVELAKRKFITKVPTITEMSLLTASNRLFSGFANPVMKAAKQFNVSYRDIFKTMGDRNVLGGQEDLIIEIAQELQKKRVKQESSV